MTMMWGASFLASCAPTTAAIDNATASDPIQSFMIGLLSGVAPYARVAPRFKRTIRAMDPRKPGLGTLAVHAGEERTLAVPSLTTPIYRTTTFRFESAAQNAAYLRGEPDLWLYSRYENPTVRAAEEKLAALLGAEEACLFASGMAAITTTILSRVKAGDEILCAASIYGGVFRFLRDDLSRWGVATRFVAPPDLPGAIRDAGPAARLVVVETPVNPTLRVLDLRALSTAARARGLPLLVDSTFASPVNQRTLALGAELVLESCTKYLGGHSDVLAGVVAGARADVAPARKLLRNLGGTLDPTSAYELLRGMKTLEVRVRRQNESALAVARALEGRVARVLHPGLASHPDHALAREQMSGAGGMVTIEVAGGLDGASRVYDRLKLIARASSLGGVESVVSLPVLSSHWGFSPDELRAAGVTDGMLRISIGLEDPADLIADLEQALA